ncbi:hypothetical protein KIPB_016547, partial [Kipferlia bialata]
AGQGESVNIEVLSGDAELFGWPLPLNHNSFLTVTLTSIPIYAPTGSARVKLTAPEVVLNECHIVDMSAFTDIREMVMNHVSKLRKTSQAPPCVAVIGAPGGVVLLS